MSDLPGQWTHLPNVVGYAWESHYPDVDDKIYYHELTWSRPQWDPGDVFYHTRVGNQSWSPPVRIREPERFGFDNTLKGFKCLVENFLAESKKEEAAPC